MTYIDIAAQIVAELNTITAFNIVYAYEPKELKEYPCATVTALSHTDEFADTHHNIRNFSFAIRVYYRTEDVADSESVMQKVVDKVIAEIEGNITLNGSCDFAVPSSARWSFVEREIPLRVCELTITAKKRLLR